MLFFGKKYIKDEDYLLKAREIIMGKLMFASLPFRVWNHFFCVKDLNIVLTCACIVQKYRTILMNICMCQLNSSLFLLETVLLQLKKFIYVRIQMLSSIRIIRLVDQKILASSPFLLSKMYLDLLCRIVFNISEKFILPVLFSSIKGSCRNFTICTDENSPSLKQKVIRTIFSTNDWLSFVFILYALPVKM